MKTAGQHSSDLLIRSDIQSAAISAVTRFGDSCHAGFVCSYMLEKDIEKAMRVGSEIASETLKHYGGF